MRRPTAPPSTIASGAVASVRITSSSGIFSTGEKKCMPSTRSGRPRLGGDLVDRNGGGVAGEDGVRAGGGLDLGEHPALERQLLEDRLDHQIGPAEAGVGVDRRRA